MLYAVALLLTGAVMTACSGSEDITGNTTPEPQTPTVKGAVMLKGTIGGKDATTRTIADDGKGTWSEGDQLAIYYQTTSGYSTAVATVNSINTKLMVLPDDTICYPGHESATTIEFERNNNMFL